MKPKLKKVLESGPMDAEWLANASEEDILEAVDNGSLNLAMSYLYWHRDLLEALWEEEDERN